MPYETGICLGLVSVLAVLIVGWANLRWRSSRNQLLKSNIKPYGPHRTGFAARYPYWCSQCRTFAQHDQVHEEVRDGDWGDYTAVVHNKCGGEVSDKHITHPRKVFIDIVSDNPAFNSKDKRTQTLLENAFDAAFAEFRSGQMPPVAVLEFEAGLSNAEVLMRLLQDKGYVIQW